MSKKESSYGKVLPAAVAAMAVTAAFVALPNEAHAAAGASFSDLKEGESGFNEVASLLEQNVIGGYSDGTFKPYAKLSREHAAVLLARAFELPEPANLAQTLSAYKDVAKEHPYAKEIAAVTEAKIFQGGSGQFNGKKEITREQMATVLVKAFNLKANGKEVDLADLQKVNAAHRENVKILAQHGISVGKMGQDGQHYFDGGVSLNRVQFAVFLDKSLKGPKSVDSITDGKVKISGKTYQVPDKLKGLFNAKNRELLADAGIAFETANGEIAKVTSLELVHGGTADQPAVLDGAGSEIDGSVSVKGKHVELSNLAISQDLNVYGEGFKGNGLKVGGQTAIKDAELARSAVRTAAFTGSVIFENCSLGPVNVSKSISFEVKGNTIVKEITITKNGRIITNQVVIPKLFITGNTSDVEVNGKVTDVEVSADAEQTEISGTADFDNLVIEKGQNINLSTKGSIGQFVPKQKTVKINLSEGTKVINITLPNGVTFAKEIILNYDQVKGHFEQIGGKPNPDVPVVTPPAYGGGNSSSSAEKIINSAGTYNGQLTLTANGADDVTYGPAEGKKTIHGTVTINGNASGTIHLRNLYVTSTVIINAPNAQVETDALYANKVIVEDVSKDKGLHFGSETLAKYVLFKDLNGGRIVSPTDIAAINKLELIQGTDIRLEGKYSELIASGDTKIKFASASDYVYRLIVTEGKTAEVDALSGRNIWEIKGPGKVVNAEGSQADFALNAAPTLELSHSELKESNYRDMVITGHTVQNADVDIFFSDKEQEGMFSTKHTVANEDGEFVLSFKNSVDKLSDGSYEVYAISIDANGRKSTASVSHELKVETAPAISSVKFGGQKVDGLIDEDNKQNYYVNLNEIDLAGQQLVIGLNKPGHIEIKSGEQTVHEAVGSQIVQDADGQHPELVYDANQVSFALNADIISRLRQGERLTLAVRDNTGNEAYYYLAAQVDSNQGAGGENQETNTGLENGEENGPADGAGGDAEPGSDPAEENEAE